jgi:hypothetical protein
LFATKQQYFPTLVVLYSVKNKKVAILQSNYIPWKGYFDIIAAVDEFILYDDMQFTKNDWRNRNQIKTPQGVQWISIPVGQCIGRRIRDVELPDNKWKSKHWKTLENNYRRAPHFEEIASIFKPLYLDSAFSHLSQLNRCFVEAVCNYLGIKTVISNSWNYAVREGKTERLVDLCLQSGATEYISGPAARDYIEDNLFAEQGIKKKMSLMQLIAPVQCIQGKMLALPGVAINYRKSAETI